MSKQLISICMHKIYISKQLTDRFDFIHLFTDSVTSLNSLDEVIPIYQLIKEVKGKLNIHTNRESGSSAAIDTGLHLRPK